MINFTIIQVVSFYEVAQVTNAKVLPRKGDFINHEKSVASMRVHVVVFDYTEDRTYVYVKDVSRKEMEL